MSLEIIPLVPFFILIAALPVLVGKNRAEMLYQKADSLTKERWFYAVLFLCVFIPPYTQYGFSSFKDLVEIVSYVADFLIENKLALVPYMPLFHAGLLLLLISLFVFRNKFGQLFSFVVGVHFVFVTFLQGGASTDKYGLVLYPNSFLLFSLVSGSWFWEASVRKTNFSFKRQPAKLFWFAGLVAFFSFWNPDKLGALSPLSLITSTSPIAYCMITPIYLSIYLLFYPDINLPLFRITSFIGILVAVIVIGMGFFMENRLEGYYWSLLHSPMLVTTVYCFLLGIRTPRPQSG